MKDKICKLCGQSFTPKSSRQIYCKKEIVANCSVCGSDFITYCTPDSPKTCSNPECKKKAGYIGLISKKKVCKICGSEFIGTSATQEYCNNPVNRICQVCGKEFIIRCTAEEYKKQTCSEECMQKLALQNRQFSYMQNNVRICELCGKEFHPITNTQRVCESRHYAKCKVCGKEFELNYKSSSGQVDLRKTCSDDCLNKLRSDNCAFRKPEVQGKIRNTIKMKYGCSYPSQNPEIVKKMYSTYQSRTGYSHPSHNPDRYRNKNLKFSSLESKFKNVLDNNNIEYIHQHVLNKEGVSHAFDFWLTKYKILVDIDGAYYHGYLDDSNGEQVSEDRDDIRVSLVDPDQIYVVITETNFNSEIAELLNHIRDIDENAFDYNEFMFDWCRKIGFPYPSYTNKRLKHDYHNLCNYSIPKYNCHAKLGLSSIRHFHKSIYNARVGTNPSIKQAWNDDSILKKVIYNRMIYKNDVDPSKILAGFYISKVVPKVSIFNPVLARYLIQKYLNEFPIVTDPFSGFSGRLLGTTSLGKQYVGYDINENAVRESNLIIQFHNLNASVSYKDILSTRVPINCDCLLTCPPYSNKETYSTETVYHTCDDWIDIVRAKYICKRYVFVVDCTSRYSEYVTEQIITKSYFNDISEYVIVIDQ